MDHHEQLRQALTMQAEYFETEIQRKQAAGENYVQDAAKLGAMFALFSVHAISPDSLVGINVTTTNIWHNDIPVYDASILQPPSPSAMVSADSILQQCGPSTN